MAFPNSKHNERNLALGWYFRKTFLQVVIIKSFFFFPYGYFLLSYGCYFVFSLE